MSEQVYLLTICLPLGTILLIYGMRYASAVQQAKVRLDRDEAYRELAARTVAAESETATALSAIEAAITDVAARLAGIEKVLKEVE